MQGRFAHLFKEGNKEVLAGLQDYIDQEWDKLLWRCGEEK